MRVFDQGHGDRTAHPRRPFAAHHAEEDEDEDDDADNSAADAAANGALDTGRFRFIDLTQREHFSQMFPQSSGFSAMWIYDGI